MVNSFPQVTLPTILRRDLSRTSEYGVNPVWNFNTNQVEETPDGRYIYTNDSLGLAQLVMKIIKTERGKYPIYPATYGSDLHTLIGMDPEFVKARIPKMIKDALEFEPRIGNVIVRVGEQRGNSIFVEVTAQDMIARQPETLTFTFSDEEGVVA